MNQRNNDRGGKKKKSSYKTKRSFTRNKKLRSDSPDKAPRMYTKDGEAFPAKKRGKGFDKEKRESNRDKRVERKERYASRDKEGRDDRKDFREKREGFKGHQRGDERRSEHKFDRKEKYSGEERGDKRDFKEKREGFKSKRYDDDRKSERGFERKERYSRDDKGRGEKRDFKEKREGFKSKGYDNDRKSERGFGRKESYSGENESRGDKNFKEKREGFKSKYGDERKDERGFERKEKSSSRSGGPKKSYRDEKHKKTFAEEGLIRLNRYIANAGICSRREADDLIATGCVSVNGKIVTEMGYKVKPSDVVTYDGEQLKSEKLVYLLLNKPKDYITTSEDDRGRRTVMELIDGACKERVYPVGRLDRNTTGLLLFTNDGDLAKKLTHPQHNVQKLYHVELDKNLKHDDLLAIQNGIELEDGFIKPDEVAYAGESKREVGIMIHSGRNRIVRRIFESLGYDVLRLDRILFAGLSKKNLPRGRWRLLTDKEIAFLKMT